MSLLFGMGQIKKVSLKPGFEDCYWRTFQYCSRKWVTDGRSWVTETTSGEVSFGERLTQQNDDECPTTVNSTHSCGAINDGWDRLALRCAGLWMWPSPSCRWFSDQPATSAATVWRGIVLAFGARSVLLRYSAHVEVSGRCRSERRTWERCSSHHHHCGCLVPHLSAAGPARHYIVYLNKNTTKPNQIV